SLRLALQNAEWIGGGSAGGRDRDELTNVDATDNVLEEAIKEENEPIDDEVANPTSAVADVNARSTESPADAPIEPAESAILRPSIIAVEEKTFPHLALMSREVGKKRMRACARNPFLQRNFRPAEPVVLVNEDTNDRRGEHP